MQSRSADRASFVSNASRMHKQHPKHTGCGEAEPKRTGTVQAAVRDREHASCTDFPPSVAPGTRPYDHLYFIQPAAEGRS